MILIDNQVEDIVIVPHFVGLYYTSVVCIVPIDLNKDPFGANKSHIYF